MSHVLRLARPRHWIKNLFLLVPVPFALAAGAEFEVGSFLLGFFGFCLLSSGVYAANDVVDRERDRGDPRKANRPVASGEIGVGLALALAAAWLACGIFLLHLADRSGVVAAGLYYLALQAIYSGGAKHVPILDVFILSGGFLLRVLAGCALVEAKPSNWILLCTSGLALFLALGKRRADLAQGLGSDQRPSLRGYSLGFVDQALAIAAGVTLLAYALYCREAVVLIDGRQFWSLPFAAAGLLEYLRLLHLSPSDPTELITRRPTLWLIGCGWAIAVRASLATA